MVNCVVSSCNKRSATSNLSKDGVSYHIFPKVQYLRDIWKSFCNNRRTWKPTRTSVICSEHFKASDYQVLKNNRRKLVEGAIPTIIPNCVCSHHPTSKVTASSEGSSDVIPVSTPVSTRSPIQQQIESGPSCSKIIKTESLDAPTTSSIEAVSTLKVEDKSDSDEDPLNIPRCASPSGLSDIGSSDLEGALDTPTVLYLKKKLSENQEKLREKDKKLRENEVKLRENDNKLAEKDEKIESLQKVNKRLNEKIITLKQLLVKMKRKILNMKRKENDDSDNKDLEPSQDT